MTVNFQQQVKVTKHSENFSAHSIPALAPLIPSFLDPPLVLLSYLSGSALLPQGSVSSSGRSMPLKWSRPTVTLMVHIILKGSSQKTSPLTLSHTHTPNAAASKGETKVRAGYPATSLV